MCLDPTEHTSAGVAGGRVFIAGHVIPDVDKPHFAKLFDIHMMVWGTRRERTGEEYAALLQSAGWHIWHVGFHPPELCMLLKAQNSNQKIKDR
jgi:hypothetical protein